TWDAAYASAQCAIAAADAVDAGDAHAYALCRPPGHHAYPDQAGGFCFLNNSAIAAQRLLEQGHRPAILDIDVHHGNGTQGIFYARGDVLTVSIHADPADFYPFFWGHAQERGQGDGLGANLNLPLPRSTGDDVYMAALDTALTRIADFGTTALVIALGLDAHEDDPFKGLALTTP
ncbi:MAG: histone deacetylase family protein, partial [Actinomycetota bacterium]